MRTATMLLALVIVLVAAPAWAGFKAGEETKVGEEAHERGEVDGQNPPESMIEAYLLVAEVRTKRLSGIPWGDGTHDLADDEEGFLDAALMPKLAVCTACGASNVEHFYTSKHSGKTLCTDCYHTEFSIPDQITEDA